MTHQRPASDPAGAPAWDWHAFHNALRVMISIDLHEMVECGALHEDDMDGWLAFTSDPYKWMIRAPDDRAEKLFELVQYRMDKSSV